MKKKPVHVCAPIEKSSFQKRMWRVRVYGYAYCYEPSSIFSPFLSFFTQVHRVYATVHVIAEDWTKKGEHFVQQKNNGTGYIILRQIYYFLFVRTFSLPLSLSSKRNLSMWNYYFFLVLIRLFRS